MSTLLIRGISPEMRKWIGDFASKRNLSLSEAVIQLLEMALKSRMFTKRSKLEQEVDDEIIRKGKDVIKDFDISREIVIEPSKKERERRQKEAFKRIDKVRKELHEKYGKFDDSTKLIREDRDSR